MGKTRRMNPPHGPNGPEADPLCGRVLAGRDRLHERLGIGGFEAVCGASDLANGAADSAVKVALNQWDALCVFLDDEHVPPDNNLSENALRVIALGRKNWQLVGHEEAGQNTAVLHTIVACCALAGVNPQEDLADVLIRVQTHPSAQVAELLPERWKVAREADRAAAASAKAAVAAGAAP